MRETREWPACTGTRTVGATPSASYRLSAMFKRSRRTSEHPDEKARRVEWTIRAMTHTGALGKRHGDLSKRRLQSLLPLEQTWHFEQEAGRAAPRLFSRSDAPCYHYGIFQHSCQGSFGSMEARRAALEALTKEQLIDQILSGNFSASSQCLGDAAPTTEKRRPTGPRQAKHGHQDRAQGQGQGPRHKRARPNNSAPRPFIDLDRCAPRTHTHRVPICVRVADTACGTWRSASPTSAFATTGWPSRVRSRARYGHLPVSALGQQVRQATRWRSTSSKRWRKHGGSPSAALTAHSCRLAQPHCRPQDVQLQPLRPHG
jgi:hypothetical protein